MTAQQLGDYIFTTKYAGWNEGAKRRETFDEATTRMFDMHRSRYSYAEGIGEHIDFAESAFRDGLVLGSQRALQFGGQPVLKKNASNCVVRCANCLPARYLTGAPDAANRVLPA